jgi:hypothetical protein
LLDDPEHWRDKADEARAKADEMGDPEAQEIMRRVADEYDRLAKEVERQFDLK